jgi:hypothetical protein
MLFRADTHENRVLRGRIREDGLKPTVNPLIHKFSNLLMTKRVLRSAIRPYGFWQALRSIGASRRDVPLMRSFYRSLTGLSLSGAALSVVTAHAAPVATNMPGVTATMEVPAGFNPLTATPQLLEAAGLPPRPDGPIQRGALASWQRAVTSHARHVMPHLAPGNVKHGPYQTLPYGDYKSYNWSGYAVGNTLTSYSPSGFYAVDGTYVVPVAAQAYGACTGGWVYSASWVGIDGYGSSDVLAAGTDSDAYCSGSTKQASYTAWYAWYPAGEVKIGGFPIGPGDDIFIEVWSSSATVGHAYIMNYNTNQDVNLTFNAPSGTMLTGNSAEWVVERPLLGGTLTPLTNYIQDFFWNTYAFDFDFHVSYPGLPYAGITAVPMYMLDNSGNEISSPTVMDFYDIQFTDQGSAQ